MVNDYQGVMPNDPESLTSPEQNLVSTPDDELQGVEATRAQSERDRMATGAEVTSDIDANREQAKVVGDEAVGGLAPTPGQNLTESNAAAVGVEIPDRQPLEVQEMIERRDDRRWELDPKSSEDYSDHGS